MSYAFDATMDALGNKDQQQAAPQTNVFQQDQGGAQPGSNDTVTSSSSGGSLAGAPATTSPSSQQAPGVQGQNVANSTARQSVMKQNAGRNNSPIDVGQVTNSIGEAKSNLQNEANTYVSNAANLAGGGKIDSGLQSSIDAFTKSGTPSADVTNAINGGAPAVAQPWAPQTTLDTRAVDNLQNNAGLMELYRERSDPQYSRGEAALDASLLTKNDKFNAQRAQAINAQNDFKKTAAALGASDSTGVNAQAQNAANDAYNARKAAITGQLQGAVGGIQDAAQGRFDDYNKIAGAYGDTGGRWQDFASGEDANRYNAIESALGQGGSALTGAGSFYGKQAVPYEVQRAQAFEAAVKAGAKEQSDKATADAARQASAPAVAPQTATGDPAADAAAAKAAADKQAADAQKAHDAKTINVGGVPIGITNKVANQVQDTALKGGNTPLVNPLSQAKPGSVAEKVNSLNPGPRVSEALQNNSTTKKLIKHKF